MPVDIDKLEALRAAARAQPGAVERAMGIKFGCPECRKAGYDKSNDNAILFHEGGWGCAVAADTEAGRAHWNAIGLALGAFHRQNGLPPPREEQVWQPPEPVSGQLPAVPAFDVAMLPDGFASWVQDIAVRAQCPIDYVAIAAMVAAGAVVGRRITIRPKQQDDWVVVPNLWGLLIGPPGVMKSPALREALTPLSRLVAEAHKAHQEQMADHEFRRAEDQLRRDTIKQHLKEAIRRGRSTDAFREDFKTTAYTSPTERRYVVNDSTVEKLGELLNENPNGLLLYRDELAGFLRTMDRDGHENDRAFYCEAWNGTGEYVYDRIGRGTVRIEAACVSILGGIQPGPLYAYLREVFGQGQDDDGLIQRFQLAVYPDIARTWRNVDRWPDGKAKSRVFEIVKGLAAVQADELAAHRPALDEAHHLPFLRFTPEAQATFDAWRASLEHQVRAGDESPVLIGHLAKFRSLMPSLALLLHLVDCVYRGAGGPVTDDATTRAVAWCRYLEAHARRLYEAVTGAARMSAAVLAARIRAGKVPSPFRARQVRLNGWEFLSDQEDVANAIGMLEDLGWLRAEPVGIGTRGRPTVQYHINPAVKPR
jgi:Protein of unknown function (DUF3987)